MYVYLDSEQNDADQIVEICTLLGSKIDLAALIHKNVVSMVNIKNA